MTHAEILTADVLDLIFYNRNKEYGAYELRKHYADRLYKSLSFVGIAIIIGCFFILNQKIPEGIFVRSAPDISSTNILMPVTEKSIEVAPMKKKTSSATAISSRIIMVDNVAPAPAPPLLVGGNTGDAVEGPLTIETGIRLIAPAAPAMSQNATPVVEPVADGPLLSAEVNPSYPGGLDALTKFLQRHLQDPGLQTGEVVSVMVRFVVGIDGLMKGFEVVKSGTAPYDNEVVRVLKKMPAWIPGKSNGKNVSVYYTIPVKFVPQE